MIFSISNHKAEFAEKYLAIVNFVCLPEKEFEEKKVLADSHLSL